MNLSCTYQVDAEDKIIYVGGGWNAFAIANEGDSLLSSSPLGQPLWSFINGLPTRFIYHNLVNKVRKTRQKISFPFRCDAPDILRYMEMEISPGADDSIWFRTTLKKEIGPDTLSHYANPSPIEAPLIKMCAWCDLVSIQDNWVVLEEAIWSLGLFDGSEVPPFTHGICPDCNQILQAEISEMKRALQENPV